ncbi:MAG TPA: SMI1/KNR4 family protein [Pirellulaceae bacterium]|nr:SMI1/KNR4 family protein [Pirellulaceae bacterium]
MKRKGPKLTTKSILALESAIDAAVPQDYLCFLHATNGGSASGLIFSVPGKKGTRYINDFLAASQSIRGPLAILDVRKQCTEFIPKDALPIAFVSGDDLLLLRTRPPKRFGAIDLKINSDVTNHDDPESGVVRVAKSFEAFMTMVKQVPEEELDDDDYGMW